MDHGQQGAATAARPHHAGPVMPGPHRHYKWELLLLLFWAFFFYYADRAIFGVVVGEIKKDLNLSDAQLGLVSTVMFFALALCMPLAGMVGDLFSRKWVITCSLIFWSLATAVTGSAQSLTALILVRSIATAGSESFYSPAAMSLLAAYHRETRAFAMSVHQGSLYVGVMTSGFLGGWIAEHYGWRMTFYIFGVIGVALGALFIWRLKDAPRETAVAPTSAARQVNHPIQALAVMFRIPTALLLLTGFTAVVFVNNAYVMWAPRLLQEKFSLSMTAAGSYSMFYHHITALIAVLLGGYISDRLVRAYPRVRLLMMTVSMLSGALTVLALGMAPSLAGTCLAMGAFGLCRGFYECNTHASLFDVIEPRHRGSAVAVMIMVAFIIGSQSPLLLGWCSDHWGAARGLSLGFSAFSGVYALGGLAVAAALLWTGQRDRIVETAH